MVDSPDADSRPAFSGVEVVFPLFVDAFPRGLFAALSALFTGAAFVARILAQRNMPQ